VCSHADDTAPDAPSITTPTDGARDVFVADLAIAASAFADADGDGHLETEWEIWETDDGFAEEKVWTAVVDDAALLTTIDLADGTFLVGDDLVQDEAYVVRARYRSDGACQAWSEWSAPHAFEIEDGSADFFDPTQVRDLYLEIPPTSWDAIDAQAVQSGCAPHARSNYPATLTFEGQSYAIGLKTKGGCGSQRNLSSKPSWKINLAWDDPAIEGCAVEQKVHGLKHITLNNEVQDKSFIHEQLAYHFYRLLGLPVPRVNNMRVWVKKTTDAAYAYWGVYLNVETVDRKMLRRNFASNRGMMYEGTYSCDLVSSNVPPTDGETNDILKCLGREFSTDACDTPEVGDDPTDYSVIRGLVTSLEALPSDDMYPGADDLLDYDQFLTLWAADNIIHHWDGFVYNRNNYRIYRDPSTARWTVIPSGVDQTFAGSPPSAFNTSTGVTKPIITANRCLQQADCKAAFAAKLDAAIDVFEAADLGTLAQTIHDRIATDVANDPRRPGSVTQFDDGLTAAKAFITSRPAAVRADLTNNGFPP
jgi:spore coat protein CotH